MSRILFILLVLAGLPGHSFAAEAPILPTNLITSINAFEVHAFRCARNAQCQLRCSAGEGHEQLDYQNVKRAEWAQGTEKSLLGVIFVDAVGKGHSSMGLMPMPMSCLMDDLEWVRTMPVIDGDVFRPSTEDEVIFDLQPSP